MELKSVAKAWIDMWKFDSTDPARRVYGWVDDFEFRAIAEDPELALDLVLEVLALGPDQETRALLAAGPLEQVLAEHGDVVITRVETLAQQNPSFSQLLSGVWQNAIPGNVWSRIQHCWTRETFRC